MEDLAMCRVCLAEDVRLRLIVNTHLQEMYESLTLLPLKTKDSRPIRACYICCAGLQNCYRLRKRCLQSEELLTQVWSSDKLQPIKLREGCTQRLRVAHPVIHLSIGNIVKNNTDDDTTENSAHNTEATDVANRDTAVKQEDFKTEPQEEDDAQCSHLEHSLDVINEEPDADETNAEDIKIEDIIIEENEPYSAYQSSLSVDIICPKIAKVVLERTVLSDTIPATGVPAVKKIDSLLVTTPDTIDKINAKLHDNSDNTVLEHYEVHKETRETNICSIKIDYKPKSNLKCHKRTYTGEKRFPCDVCNKLFKHKHYLSRHMFTHTGERPFQCNMCNKAFHSNDHLKRHMAVHTGDKRFQCNMCNKAFRSKDYLKRHVAVHTGEKRFQCNTCNKSFRCKHNLTQHMNLHSGEKRFQCQLCNKFFSRKHHLIRHIYTHTGEKQFQCNKCNKYFSRKHHLTRHEYTHTGEKRFQCNTCNESFFRKYNLTRHNCVGT